MDPFLTILLTSLGGFIVNVTFIANSPVEFCSPFNSRPPPFFFVGNQPEYIGPLSDRIPCAAIKMNAGESYSRSFDLERYYHFEIGKYSVGFLGQITLISQIDDKIERLIKPPELLPLNVLSASKIQVDDPPIPCDAEHIKKNEQNQKRAARWCNFAYLELADDARYHRFFGEKTFSDFHSEIKLKFTKTKIGLASKTVNYSCGGSDCEDTYAYVYPGRPTLTIYLCPLFWTRDVGDLLPVEHCKGTQTGTIIHETMHFFGRALPLPGEKETYGVANCEQLAKDNPQAALRNADSYRYFAENPPNPCPPES